jgi:hypothetical protein
LIFRNFLSENGRLEIGMALGCDPHSCIAILRPVLP